MQGSQLLVIRGMTHVARHCSALAQGGSDVSAARGVPGDSRAVGVEPVGEQPSGVGLTWCCVTHLHLRGGGRACRD